MVKSKLLILLLPTFLLGCAAPQPPIIKTEIQTVKVPIEVPCKVAIPVVPPYGFDTLQKSDDIYKKTQVLLSDRLLSKGYEDKMRAALNTCTK